MYISVCVCVTMCVTMCVCICIFIYKDVSGIQWYCVVIYSVQLCFPGFAPNPPQRHVIGEPGRSKHSFLLIRV